MSLFRVQIKVVTTDVYRYVVKAPEFAAAQVSAEYDEPDPMTRKNHNVQKKIVIREINRKRRSECLSPDLPPAKS